MNSEGAIVPTAHDETGWLISLAIILGTVAAYLSGLYLSLALA
jgi:hypothetical protein